MHLLGLDVDVDRRDVTVRSGGATVATARWTGRTLEERCGSLTSDTWAELEAAIAASEERAISMAAATDESGVDLTLIDWMLTLTPTERLRVLMRHASGLAGFVRDDVRE